MQLSTLRQQIERFSIARAGALLQTHAGREQASLESVHRSWSRVLTVDAFAQVRDAARDSDGRRSLRLRRLAAFLAGMLAEQGAAASIDAIDSRRRTITIPDPEGGPAIPLQHVDRRIQTQRSREAREVMERNLRHQLARNNRPHLARAEALQSTAERLGYTSTLDLLQREATLDLQPFAEDCRRFLNDTEGMYRDLLSWRLRQIGAPRLYPHGAQRHDVLRAANPAEFEGLFQSPPSRLEGELLRIGLHPRADGRIRIDSENRSSRTSHALVIAVSAPSDVVLLHRPTGGFEDTWNRLSALGQALHAANTTADRPFEDRMLGDEAVPLGFGAALAHLLLDKRWNERVLQAKAPDLIRVLAFAILTRARHDSATTLVATGLHQHGPGETVRELYVHTLSRSLLGEWPRELLFHDVDPTFPAATRLRGLALETVLHEQLLTRFDEDWWRNPSTGAWLHDLFAQGRFEGADQLAQRFGKQKAGIEEEESTPGRDPPAAPESARGSDAGATSKQGDASGSLESLEKSGPTQGAESMRGSKLLLVAQEASEEASDPTSNTRRTSRSPLDLGAVARRLEALID